MLAAFPPGKLSEIVGPRSSGGSSLLLQLLARATHDGGHVALVDATDALCEEVREADAGHTNSVRSLARPGQTFAISSISLSNTAQTRSLSSEKNSRVTNGGTPRLGLGRSNTSDGNV